MVSKETAAALAAAKAALKDNPDVVSVGLGYKYKDGRRTDQICIVVGVRKKRPSAEVVDGRAVPASIGGVPVDVIQYGEVKAHALVARRRPCPPGYSVGHPSITAGTLGAWVRRGSGSERYVLSNNHVIAASNDGAAGDPIRQPGVADGGTAADRLATLTDYVQIGFDGADSNAKKSAAAWAWRIWMWPANVVARLLGCPFRLAVSPRQVSQPYPNLVDAAVAQVAMEEWVDEEVPQVGPLAGIRDLQLGDKVQKTGRTTEHTRGEVETVGAQIQVDYGAGKGTATFDDQLIVRADSGEFSQPGDSGSAVLSDDAYLGGLLFAGGEGITVVNRISHVVSLLGVRL